LSHLCTTNPLIITIHSIIQSFSQSVSHSVISVTTLCITMAAPYGLLMMLMMMTITVTTSVPLDRGTKYSIAYLAYNPGLKNN